MACSHWSGHGAGTPACNHSPRTGPVWISDTWEETAAELTSCSATERLFLPLGLIFACHNRICISSNGGMHFGRTCPAKEATADRSGPRNPAPGNYVRLKKLTAASWDTTHPSSFTWSSWWLGGIRQALNKITFLPYLSSPADEMPEITGSLRTTLWSWQQRINTEWGTTITRQKSGLPQLPAKLNLIFITVTMGLVWKQKPEHQGPGKANGEQHPCSSPERRGRTWSQDALGHVVMETSGTEQSAWSINPTMLPLGTASNALVPRETQVKLSLTGTITAPSVLHTVPG